MSDEVSPRYVWFIASIAALGGLLFGYDWVVIGGAKPFYEAFFRLTTASQEGWAMSCALVGCLIGAVISGILSEALGRKRSLQIAAAAFVVSSCGTALAASFASFVLWRISGGLAIGLASSLSPMYIAEIAPAAIRGKLVCLNELTIVLGLLSAQVMNWLIAKPIAANATTADILASWNGQHAWRWMFGLTAVPATLFLVGTFIIPESPRWLALRGRTAKASSILTRIGGPSNAAFILDEIAATPRSQGFAHELHALIEPRLRRVLLLGIALAVLQQ